LRKAIRKGDTEEIDLMPLPAKGHAQAKIIGAVAAFGKASQPPKLELRIMAIKALQE
jgi:hypothetical protein